MRDPSGLEPLHPTTLDRLLTVLEPRHHRVLEGLHPDCERTNLEVRFAMPRDFAPTGRQTNGVLQSLAARGLAVRVERSRTSDDLKWLLSYRGGQVRECLRELALDAEPIG